MTERSKVKVGPAPHGHVGYSEALDRVWVLNSGARTISVLDGASGALNRTIDVGGSPRHVIIDDDAGLAFVAVDDALVIVDAKAGRVSKRLLLKSGEATCLLPMLPRKRMYVLGDAGTMTIVDTERQEIAGTLPTGRGSNWGQPHENSCGKLYITNAATDDLTIIDEATERVIASATVGRTPHRNAIFRERGLIYTANLGDDTVTAVSIETDAVVATVPAGPVPFRLIGMEKKTGRSDLWVLDRGSDERGTGVITVISGTEHRVTGSIPVMDRPCNWLFKGPTAHVAGSGSRDLLIIDGKTSAVVGSATLTEEPDRDSFSNMVFSTGGNLFLANADDTVSVFAAD
jgi:YVTN family beta-propeller protein